jgi:hypothetical protein
MATWTTFATEAPEMAALAERRFTATGLALLATLRADGFPRISPLEPMVAGDELVLRDGYMVLGMMPLSTKALDLRRDPRMALHAATVDKMVSEGDAKLWGNGVEVTDDGALGELADLHERLTGYHLEPGDFHMFQADLLGVSTVRIEGGAMFVDTWTPGTEPRTVKKHDG